MTCESEADEEIESAVLFHEYAMSVRDKHDDSDYVTELDELVAKAKQNRYDAETVTGPQALKLCYTGKTEASYAFVQSMRQKRTALQGELASILEKIEPDTDDGDSPEEKPSPSKGGSSGGRPAKKEVQEEYKAPAKKSSALPLIILAGALGYLMTRRLR